MSFPITPVARQFFGTDGIRGRANTSPMTADVALKVGQAAGVYFRAGTHRHRVVIAKDTRLSGYLLETALSAGFISVGMDVILVGPLPTPAVAMLTRSLRADLGVMISASHNPYPDNGIKLFNRDGYKLSDEAELTIEALMQSDLQSHLVSSELLGRAKRIEDARGRYIECAKASFPRGLRLDGLKLVVDAANGAAYQVAPAILRELGAEIIPLAITPDGTNINADCGSTHPRAMQEAVLAHGADAGIALDGDADRIVMCDATGALLDGDQLLAIIATHLQEIGGLSGGAVVATQMSNLGFERYISSLGLELIRTDVGDRYVIEAMRERGCNIGGEQSGHIILTDYATTGDGLIAALQVLALMQTRDCSLAECAGLYTPLPQLLHNVVLQPGKNPLESAQVQAKIAEAKAELGTSGRVFIRKSGTEPKVRIMVEGQNKTQLEAMAEDLAQCLHIYS